ncbi:hypothetical protein CIRMBP1317_01211 [Enterococcus cecorum]|nr:hypothetical protein CIRMBP1317_01211 [Enterococcus cecorum]
MMFLLDKLQATTNLTANEERIATFILSHIDEIPQMTIEDLAKKNVYFPFCHRTSS